MLYALYFLPRVPLVSMGGFTVHVFDAIALSWILVLFLQYLKRPSMNMPLGFLILLCVALLSLISSLVTLSMFDESEYGVNSNPFFVLKFLEVACFFLIGRSLRFNHWHFASFLRNLILFQAAIVALQIAGLVPSVLSDASGTVVVWGVVSGTFAGSWDLAYVLSFCGLTYLNIINNERRNHAASLFAYIFMAGLLWTIGQRAPLTIFLLCGILLIGNYRENREIFTFALLGAALLFYFKFDYLIVNAFEFYFFLAQDLWATMLTSGLQRWDDVINPSLMGVVDRSFMMRLEKWVYGIYELEKYDWVLTFIGFGPGYFGTAVDGGFFRVFFETGVIGLILFLIFLSYMATRIGSILPLAFGLSNVLFDSYIATNFASFVYLTFGFFSRGKST